MDHAIRLCALCLLQHFVFIFQIRCNIVCFVRVFDTVKECVLPWYCTHYHWPVLYESQGLSCVCVEPVDSAALVQTRRMNASGSTYNIHRLLFKNVTLPSNHPQVTCTR